MRRVRAAAPTTILLFVLAALLLRLTLRDRLPLLATVYYATPPAMLVLLSIVAAIGLRHQRRWLPTLTALCLVAVTGTWWARQSFRHPLNKPAPAKGVFRVATWNIGRAAMGLNGALGVMSSIDADLFAIVEAGADSPDVVAHWRQTFPDRHLSEASLGLVLISRWPILEQADGDIGSGGRCKRCLVDTPEGKLQLVLVDIRSNPLRSRREPIQRLDRYLRDLPPLPTVVLGDFNTPVDSVFFDPLRERFRHAFETAGDGYGCTWPTWGPLMTIDHIWCGEGTKPVTCSTRWTWRSDHQVVVVEIGLSGDQ